MTTIRQIQTAEQIKTHFLLAYHVQPTMTVCFDGTVTSEVNRLIFNSNGPDEIVLKIISPHLPKATDVSVKYMIDGFEHHFISRIIDVKPLGNVGSFLKIRLPGVIRAVNRRNSVRINPSGQEPVRVTLSLSDKAPISCLVIDISMGGFALIVPSGDPVITYPYEIKGELHLPDQNILPTMVKLRNMIQQQDRYRIGMEFNSMSKDTLKKLMGYIVGHTVKNRDIQSSAPTRQQPLLCLIHDNQRHDDTLNYLEPFYHLVRQDIKADLKPIIQMVPDVLLFNLDTIKPHTLIPKIRTLTNLKKTPAIVINEDDAMDACLDATTLSQFKDPAALIEAVEQSISSGGNLPNGSPISLTNYSEKKIETDPKCVKKDKTILVMDLKQNIPAKLVEAIESRHITVRIHTDLKGIFDHIKKIKPISVVINSDFDAIFGNLLKILSINKFTKKLPLLIMADPLTASQWTSFKKNNVKILTFPNHMNADEIAIQLTQKF